MSIENLRKDMHMRTDSDKMMSIGWIIPLLLPIIFIILMIPSTILGIIFPGAFIVVGFLLTVMVLVAFIGAILYIIALYMLIKRRNTHFARQQFLFEDLISTLKDLATKKGVDLTKHSSLASCERHLREVKMDEGEKGAALWTILSLLTGIAVVYVFYFLMNDFHKHERREDIFWEDIGKFSESIGVVIPMSARRTTVIPDRSFVLYFILTIITLGIFGIYWFYALIKDPNSHFTHHLTIENEIIKSLGATEGSK